MTDGACRPQSPGLGTPSSFEPWSKPLDYKQKNAFLKESQRFFPTDGFGPHGATAPMQHPPGPLRVHLRLG